MTDYITEKNMSLPTIIVFGPHGCGKTRNAEALRAAFGCASIVDDWEPVSTLTQGALHLTNWTFADKNFHRSPHTNIEAHCISFECAMDLLPKAATSARAEKPTNPKDAVGIRKWRNFVTVPMTVIAEVGVAMLEGHLKYRRHNYRVAGVRSSVYVDAAMGHIMQWWEGEDLDPDIKVFENNELSPDVGISHITKAIASLVVLRDAMIQNKLNDDRPPKANLEQVRDNLQKVVVSMFEKYPEGNLPYTEIGEQMANSVDAGRHHASAHVEKHLKSAFKR